MGNLVDNRDLVPGFLIRLLIVLVILFLFGQAVNADKSSQWLEEFPFDPEEYAAMPLPEPGEVDTSPETGAKVVSFNTSTGKEVLSGFDTVETFTPVSGGEGAISEEQIKTRPRNYTELTQVKTNASYPYSATAKVFFTRNNKKWVCSGALIDPKHVLTAGHCVHEGNGGSWSHSVVVVPGYDERNFPFGSASARDLFTLQGWIENGDFDYDIGLIYLKRPVGGLSGWLGYSASGCFGLKNDLHYNQSYPASSPYTGEKMYQREGTFDSCPSSRQVRFNEVAYGGESGSAFYHDFSKCPSCYAHAVLSNGTDTWTQAPLLNSEISNFLEDIIANSTPSTYDLVPLRVNAESKGFQPGETLNGLSYVILNYSSASWSGTVTAEIYLSRDDTIDKTDELLKVDSFSETITSKDNPLRKLPSPPSVPDSVSEGTYYVGVKLLNSDHSTANNSSDGQDALRIEVNSVEDGAQMATFSAGKWWVDANRNYTWDGPDTDVKITGYGSYGNQVAIGDLDEDGMDELITFNSGTWWVDAKNNYTWDGPSEDMKISGYGNEGNKVAVGDFDGDNKDEMATFNHGTWWIDLNNNAVWDGPNTDRKISGYGNSSNQVAAGDFDGDGKDEIATFTAGSWWVDLNNNYEWNKEPTDKKIVGFGTAGNVVAAGKLPANTYTTTSEQGAMSSRLGKIAAYPNPAGQSDKVSFSVGKQRNIEALKLDVFTTSGRVIHSTGYQQGTTITWDLTTENEETLANGIYLYQLQAKATSGRMLTSRIKRLLVIK